jgi:hypothetical protein
MGHQLIQKAFFRNGEMITVLLRGKNARSSGLGMMLFQNPYMNHYGDSSKNIMFSLLSKKKWQK